MSARSTEKLFGNYHFKASLRQIDGTSDVSAVVALVGLTSKRACVQLAGAGLPVYATAAVALQRGPAGAGGEVVAVFEDAFGIEENGKLRST